VHEEVVVVAALGEGGEVLAGLEGLWLAERLVGEGEGEGEVLAHLWGVVGVELYYYCAL
jgi:hypothetical protein